MSEFYKDSKPKFTFKPMKFLISLLVIGLLAYVVFLLLDQQGKLSLRPEPKQEYVTAEVDSTIATRMLHPKSPNPVVDSVHIPDFSSLKTKADSDSLVRYDLTRHQQAVVTIDMEEHEEKVFFTFDDIKAYFLTAKDAIENFRKKNN